MRAESNASGKSVAPLALEQWFNRLLNRRATTYMVRLWRRYIKQPRR